MLCQICQKNAATVHITELVQDGTAEGQPALEERHICDRCAERSKVPSAGVSLNKSQAVWDMLKESARRARRESALSCPDCGMTLAEFRSKGRLGCPRDYEVFREHLDPLILRIHNADKHRGRLPGQDASQRDRNAQLTTLRAQLEEAIRKEAYESAARLRDEIQELEAPGETGG
jgi:protein arginine kinase activator